LALIYVDRLIQRSNFLLTDLNVHRVVITSVLLAAKFFDDAYYNNAYYAKVGGVLVSEMNGLEVDFLFRINFSLHVTPDVFDKYRAELLVHSTAVVVSPVVTSSAAAAAAVIAAAVHQQQQEQQQQQQELLLQQQQQELLKQRACDAVMQTQFAMQTAHDVALLSSGSQRITPTPSIELSTAMDASAAVDFLQQQEQQQQHGFHQQQQQHVLEQQLTNAMSAIDSFMPLQRSNSLPPVNVQQQQHHHLNQLPTSSDGYAANHLFAPTTGFIGGGVAAPAPATIPMAPSTSVKFPPPFAAANNDGMTVSDQHHQQLIQDPFLIAALENQIYPLHAAAAADLALMQHQQQHDQGGGFDYHQHHLQPPSASLNAVDGGSAGTASTLNANAAAYHHQPHGNLNVVVGRMLAGVSGAGL